MGRTAGTDYVLVGAERHLSVCVCHFLTLCYFGCYAGLQGCKNRFALFPDRQLNQAFVVFCSS